MENGPEFQKALELICSAALSRCEHKVLFLSVLDPVHLNVTALYVFLTEAQLERLIQYLDIDSNHNDKIRNICTLDRNAAITIRNG
jgi:hypothetical protein